MNATQDNLATGEMQNRASAAPQEFTIRAQRTVRGKALRLRGKTRNAELAAAIEATIAACVVADPLGAAHTAAEEAIHTLKESGAATEAALAAAERAEGQAERRWMKTYRKVDAAAAAVTAITVNDPADALLQLQTYAWAFDRRDTNTFQDPTDLGLCLEAAKRALKVLQTTRAPASTDPTVAAYRTARHKAALYAHGADESGGVGDDDGGDEEFPAADLMLATPPTDIAGAAVRLGRIIGEGFIHRASDWDCPLCPTGFGEVKPVTSDELCGAAEGQNGGADAMFRALVGVYQGLEQLAAAVATTTDRPKSRFDHWASERDRLLTESAGCVSGDPAEEPLSAASAAFDHLIRNAPCSDVDAALAKLEWMRLAFTIGDTGDEERVLEQIIAFIRTLDGPANATFQVRAQAFKTAQAEFEAAWAEHSEDASDDVVAAANRRMRSAFLALLSTPAGNAANRQAKFDLITVHADLLEAVEIIDVVEALLTGAGDEPDSPVAADAELLALGEELERRWAAEHAVDCRGSVSDEELDRVCDSSGEIVDRIHKIKPTTFAGLRVRARAVAWHDSAYDTPFGTPVTPGNTPDQHQAAAMLINDLLGFSPDTDDEALLKLGERFKALTREDVLLGNHTANPPPVVRARLTALSQELANVRDRARRLRATTPDALRIKAIICFDWQPTEGTEEYSGEGYRLSRALLADVLGLPNAEITDKDRDTFFHSEGYWPTDEEVAIELPRALSTLGVAPTVVEGRAA